MIKSALFKEIFYQSRLPQVISNLDISKYECNHAFCDFLGYTQEELQGLTLKDLSHEVDFLKDIDHLNRLLKGDIKGYQLEKRYIHKSGSIKTGNLQISLIQDDETDEQYLLAQVLDITEKKIIEHRRNTSERMYRLLAENSSDIINLHGSNGTYIYVSPSIKSTLGYNPEELLGRSPYDFIHELDRREVSLKHELVLRKVPFVIFTYRFKKKDGSYLWLETTIKAIFDEVTGEFIQMISVSRDIQQRIETNELLRKSEKLAVVGQMAAAIAHEIRNPLTPIKGFVQFLSKGESFNPAYASIVLNEIDRIDNIITEFLTLAKPNMEKQEIVYIDKIVKNVIQLLIPQAMMKNKEIHLSIDQSLISTFGDGNSLKQVFINIIQNALDAIEEQGQVQVNIETEGEHICVHIIDDGCGIPKDRIANLGEPFYSTKEKGTGLGLMTCFRIVEHHNGKIVIESEENKGTRVKVYLPR